MALAKHSLCQKVTQSVVMIVWVEARAQLGSIRCKHNRKMRFWAPDFSCNFSFPPCATAGIRALASKVAPARDLYLSSYWATAPQLKMVVLNIGFCHFSQHKFLPWESKCNRLYSGPVLPLTSWCSPLKTEGPGYGLDSLVPVLGDIKGVVGVIKKDSSFWVTFTN